MGSGRCGSGGGLLSCSRAQPGQARAMSCLMFDSELDLDPGICLMSDSELDLDLDFFQSNIEGELIEKIHKSIDNSIGIIINAGALTHTSIGIFDALSIFNGPIIEIHITNVYARESFRHKSYISPIATGIIAGLGVNSYLLAIDAVNKLIND